MTTAILVIALAQLLVLMTAVAFLAPDLLAEWRQHRADQQAVKRFLETVDK